MSDHVLLNLLKELGERDKMRGLPSILSLFHNEFNTFNNTRARMLDSIYIMTLRMPRAREIPQYHLRLSSSSAYTFSHLNLCMLGNVQGLCHLSIFFQN